MTSEMQDPMSLTEAWSDLDHLFDDLRQRFLETFGTPPAVSAPATADGAPRPTWFREARTDVTDSGTAYKIVAEIPGIPKENLDIRIRGSSVEIRGTASPEPPTTESAYVHRERVFSGYYRSLELPEPVVAADAKATVQNGLLELELPKQHPTPAETEVKVPVQ